MESVVVLYASVSSDHVSKGRTESLQKLFGLKGVPYSLLDATVDENKDLRNSLFTVSGKRAIYPQVFFKNGGDNSYTFVGLHGDIEELNDMEARMGSFSKKFAPVLKQQPQQQQQSSLPETAGGLTHSPVAAAVSLAAAPFDDAAQPGGKGAAGVPSAWGTHATGSGETYFFNTATGESSWVDPLTAVEGSSLWFQLMDTRRGRPYYYNRTTGESRWRLPPTGATA